MNAKDIVRQQHSVLVALLAANGDVMPVRVSSQISEAADELLDPVVAPDFLSFDLLGSDEAKAVLDSSIVSLRRAIPHADGATALSCGRAVRSLLSAATDWSAP